MDVPKKYSGLRFLALIIKIIAWIVLIFSIVVAVWFWMQGSKVAGLRVGNQNWTGALLLPFGLYTFIQLYIIGSLISLFADVEYNTRANATATARLITLMDKMEQRMTKSVPAVVATPPPPPPPPPAPVEPVRPSTPTERLTAPESTRPVQTVEENTPPPPPPPPPAEEVAQEPVIEIEAPLPETPEEVKLAVDAASSAAEAGKSEK